MCTPMIVWNHSATTLQDYVSPWMAAMLPLHQAYALAALDYGIVVQEADPRIKSHHTTDVGIRGCQSVDLPDCVPQPYENLVSCSSLGGAESHGQSDSVEPPEMVHLTKQPQQAADIQCGKIFAHHAGLPLSSDPVASVHSGGAQMGLRSHVICSPSSPGSDYPLRSCLRTQASAALSRGRVRFAFEIQFWFPGSSQLCLSRPGLNSLSRPASSTCKYDGLRPSCATPTLEGSTAIPISVRHVGFRPPEPICGSSPGSPCWIAVNSLFLLIRSRAVPVGPLRTKPPTSTL